MPGLGVAPTRPPRHIPGLDVTPTRPPRHIGDRNGWRGGQIWTVQTAKAAPQGGFSQSKEGD